jgi:hypothetical protein
MRSESHAASRVFQNPTTSAHRRKGRGKATRIIARAIVLTTPTGKISNPQFTPPLTRRMRNNRSVTTKKPRIPLLIPAILDTKQGRVWAKRINK